MDKKHVPMRRHTVLTLTHELKPTYNFDTGTPLKR